MFWCCALPLIIVYGILVGLRTKWNATLVSVIPALLASVWVVILTLTLPFEEGGAFLTGPGGGIALTTPVAAAAFYFLTTFSTWFIAIGAVVMLTRLVASRLRARGTLLQSDEEESR